MSEQLSLAQLSQIRPPTLRYRATTFFLALFVSSSAFPSVSCETSVCVVGRKEKWPCEYNLCVSTLKTLKDAQTGAGARFEPFFLFLFWSLNR